MGRKVFGTVLAVFLAPFAVALAVQVDWGAILSGDSDRIQEELEEGSGFADLLTLVFAYAAYRAARWAWEED